MKNKGGTVLITMGLLLMAAALCLGLYNLQENRRAGEHANDTVEQLQALIDNFEE